MAASPSNNYLFLYSLCLICVALPISASIRTSIKLDPTGHEYINKACSYGAAAAVDTLDCDLFLQRAPAENKTSAEGFAAYTLTYAQKALANLTGELEASLERCPDEDLEDDIRTLCIEELAMGGSIGGAAANLEKKDYTNVMKMTEKALEDLEECGGKIQLWNAMLKKNVGYTKEGVSELKVALTITTKIVGAHFSS